MSFSMSHHKTFLGDVFRSDFFIFLELDLRNLKVAHREHHRQKYSFKNRKYP